MGRQVQFFMSPDDEKVFFGELAKNKEILFLCEKVEDGKIKAVNYEQFINEYKIYLTLKNSKTNIKSNGFIDNLTSEIIEFVRCKSFKPKQMEPGRLWVELSYWNSSNQIEKKPEWLAKLFEQYSKWIKKNYRISKDKFCYIGEGAYRLYKEEGCEMVGGPIVRFEF